MLDLPHMQPLVFGRMARLVGVSLSLLLPGVLYAGTLREEGVEYRRQGYEAQQRGDMAEALSWYQKAAALDPSYPTPHNDMGVILEQEGRVEDAERAYLEAVALNPEYREAHTNLALLYERMGQEKEAAAHWLKRYELGDPSDPWRAHAAERLEALGIVHVYPPIQRALGESLEAMDKELQGHGQSVQDFRSVTEKYGDWP